MNVYPLKQDDCDSPVYVWFKNIDTFEVVNKLLRSTLTAPFVKFKSID